MEMMNLQRRRPGAGSGDGGAAGLELQQQQEEEEQEEEEVHRRGLYAEAPNRGEGAGGLLGRIAAMPISRNWTVGKGMRYALKGLVILIGLNVLYLLVAYATFNDPCRVAERTSKELSRSIRKGVSRQFLKNAKRIGVPKIIHQQWKDDVVPEGPFEEWHLLWKTLYPEPEYEHMLWTDESGRDLIKNEFPWFLEAYDGFYMNIQRADAVRYFVLHKYGGVYADLDYEPLTDRIWDHLPWDRVSLIESPYKINEMVQNSFMASTVNDPFWNITFEILLERKNSHKVLSSTGPAMVDEAMRRSPDKTWYHMLPCENFHRIPLGDAGKDAPVISQLARTFFAYSPLVKTCGNWREKDNCQYGLHHNAVSYMSNMGGGALSFIFNF